MELIAMLVLTLLCGILGTYSGSRNTSKAWRRYGIPLIIVGFGLTQTWWAFLSLSLCGILSKGYGVPGPGDSGSSLGQFWIRFTKNHRALDVLIRSTLGLLIVISMVYAPILSGYWITYLLMSLFFLTIHILFSAIIEKEPVINTDKYTFLSEDFIVYFNMGLYCIGSLSLI